MGMRTAFRQSPGISLAVAGLFVWTTFVVVRVWSQMGGLETFADVGQTAASGIVGLGVLLVTLALLLVVAGEFGETDPAPDPWPPEE